MTKYPLRFKKTLSSKFASFANCEKTAIFLSCSRTAPELKSENTSNLWYAAGPRAQFLSFHLSHPLLSKNNAIELFEVTFTICFITSQYFYFARCTFRMYYTYVDDIYLITR